METFNPASLKRTNFELNLSMLDKTTFAQHQDLFLYFKRVLKEWNRTCEKQKGQVTLTNYTIYEFIFSYLVELSFEMEPIRSMNLKKLYDWFVKLRKKKDNWISKLLKLKKRIDRNAPPVQTLIRSTFQSPQGERLLSRTRRDLDGLPGLKSASDLLKCQPDTPHQTMKRALESSIKRIYVYHSRELRDQHQQDQFDRILHRCRQRYIKAKQSSSSLHSTCSNFFKTKVADNLRGSDYSRTSFCKQDSTSSTFLNSKYSLHHRDFTQEKRKVSEKNSRSSMDLNCPSITGLTLMRNPFEQGKPFTKKKNA